MHETIVEIADKKFDIYPFDNIDEQNLFGKITRELRCSVCQNQTLADSDAILAVDLRNVIYQKVKQQESEQQIIQYVTSRYGEFVLNEPPFNWSTSVLWGAPIVLLVLGFYAITKLFKITKQKQ